MSPVKVTWRRTLGMSWSMGSVALSVCVFLSASALLFAFRLVSADGGTLPLPVVWASAVSPFLPALAAFLAMDVWSDERRSGRMELLATAPVAERDIVTGKFLGVFTVFALAVLLAFAALVLPLGFMSPSALSGVRAVDFLPALAASLLQGALWCAVSSMTSSMFSVAAVAACASLLLTVAIPRGVWMALMAWSPQGRALFGEMPLDAHAVDMASGIFSSGTVMSYAVLTSLSLFVSSKCVACYRLVGRGAAALKFSTLSVMALAVVLSVFAIRVLVRTDMRFYIPVSGSDTEFSLRTRDILKEGNGEVSITAFLSRKDSRFRSVARVLRALQREAGSLGGIAIDVRFVDPRWDLGSAERLIRKGAIEESLVFEKGRRTAVIPLADGFGERICASTVLRLTTPPQRRNVYWTVGHGESSVEDYGAWGMSDIARDLARDGYRNASIDLAGDSQIPADCALIVVAGAKDDFSRVEIDRLDSYLRGGGRLLVLMESARSGGVASLLPRWGVRPETISTAGLKTLSGSDVIVGDFSDHVISAPFSGSRIILDRPLGFMPSAAAETGAGVDRIEFTPLAKAGQATVAAVVERGVGAGADLSIRPTRIVAIGDAGFVMNGLMSTLSNANRDFLLNCIAYLSGTDALASSGMDADALVTGFDRSAHLRYALVTALVIPLAVLLLLSAAARLKRRRT